MQRVTISLDDELAARFDAIVRDRAYASRSEAVRDLIRERVADTRQVAKAGDCIACLSYVYNHRIRSLADRLLDLKHAHHHLVVSTTYVALDHAESLEAVFLKGPTDVVRSLADQVVAERGVRFGAINVVSVTPNDEHAEPAPHHHHTHAHLSPDPG